MKSFWATRIYTPRGFVRENILEKARALDLGCGNRKLPGAIGVDSLDLSSVDIVHDLSQFPWPFEDASFNLVFANHFLEHAPCTLRTLNEIHRILAPGGRVVIQVPYFRSVDAFSDPTHQHFFTSASLDYIIEGTKLANYAYTMCRFKKIGFWYGWPQPSHNPITRLFKAFIQRFPRFYDQYLSLVAPAEVLTWELEIIE